VFRVRTSRPKFKSTASTFGRYRCIRQTRSSVSPNDGILCHFATGSLVAEGSSADLLAAAGMHYLPEVNTDLR
jgi:hypothetical protein